jgi:acyl carrier protein
VTAVLGLAPTTSLDPRQRLFEIGLDSLMAVELKNSLQGLLGTPLPSTVVFEYPTVEALTDYLANDILALAEPEPDTAAPPERAHRLAGLADLSETELEDMLADKLASLAQRRRK